MTKIPEKFLDRNILKNVSIGEEAWIVIQTSLFLDKNQVLWAYEYSSALTVIDPDNIEDIFTSENVSFVRVLRLDNGIKLFLHEYEKNANLWTDNCADKKVCDEGGDGICTCKLFQLAMYFKESNNAPSKPEENFLQVVEYDSPEDYIVLTDFDTDINIEDINEENIINISIAKLEEYLNISLNNEQYEVSDMIQTELRRRPK